MRYERLYRNVNYRAAFFNPYYSKRYDFCVQMQYGGWFGQNMKIKKGIKKDISPMKLILGGYCMIILIGAILLALPFASRTGESTPFSDCFFTATSATCVTGLIRYDTYTGRYLGSW